MLWEDAWTNDSSRGPGPGSNKTPSTLVSASLRRFNSIDISSYVDPASNTHGQLYRTQRLTVSPKHPGSYLFYIIPLSWSLILNHCQVFLWNSYTQRHAYAQRRVAVESNHTHRLLLGSLLPPRGATQKLELCPRQQKTTRLLPFIRVYKIWNTQIYTNIGIRRSISIFLCSMRLNNCRWELLP